MDAMTATQTATQTATMTGPATSEVVSWSSRCASLIDRRLRMRHSTCLDGLGIWHLNET